MTREELIEVNEKVGMVIVNACNAWKQKLISTDLFKMTIREAVKNLPPYYWDEEEEEIVPVDDFTKQLSEEHFEECMEEIGSENDHFIYGPSSGCFLCQFIDEEAAYNIMFDLDH